MQNNGVREAIEWVLTDMRYKAPEQYIESVEAWDRRLQSTLDGIETEERISEEVKRTLLRFPQHAKAEEIAPLSQACGNFVVFLMKKGIFLSTSLMEDGSNPIPWDYDANTLNRLIAEYFGIDFDAFEREKQVMQQEIRVNEERN